MLLLTMKDTDTKFFDIHSGSYGVILGNRYYYPIILDLRKRTRTGGSRKHLSIQKYKFTLMICVSHTI